MSGPKKNKRDGDNKDSKGPAQPAIDVTTHPGNNGQDPPRQLENERALVTQHPHEWKKVKLSAGGREKCGQPYCKTQKSRNMPEWHEKFIFQCTHQNCGAKACEACAKDKTSR